MNRPFLALLVLAIFCAVSAAADAKLTKCSYAFGKQYASTVTEADIGKSPAWEVDVENPPLSAKKAMKLAAKMKDSLVNDSEHYQWRLESIALQPLGEKWYWMATYVAHFRGPSGSTGPAIKLDLIVLMDGTVIKPEVRPWPPTAEEPPSD